MEAGLINLQSIACARNAAATRKIISVAVGVPDHEGRAELPGDFIAGRGQRGADWRPRTELAREDGRAVQRYVRPVSARILQRKLICDLKQPGRSKRVGIGLNQNLRGRYREACPS